MRGLATHLLPVYPTPPPPLPRRCTSPPPTRARTDAPTHLRDTALILRLGLPACVNTCQPRPRPPQCFWSAPAPPVPFPTFMPPSRCAAAKATSRRQPREAGGRGRGGGRWVLWPPPSSHPRLSLSFLSFTSSPVLFVCCVCSFPPQLGSRASLPHAHFSV